jgi:triosephosphate isomerase (TIM)
MRKYLVAGNWKMNGTRESATRLVHAILQGLEFSAEAEILICPPFVYLADVAGLLAGNAVLLGGQNVCAEEDGAYTGEVSGSMLRDIGCRYVIVGHSERRILYNETDTTVARKFVAAQKAGLTPILCVGETLNQRQNGETQGLIERQLMAVLDVAGMHAFEHAVVAYEPVWAIGTGKTAAPEQAQEVHAFIRACIKTRDARIGGIVRLLYGGSVRASNAAELFRMPDIDGGLVGGASLEAHEFLAICRAAD